MLEEIGRLRREKGAVVLAHNYQRREIQELADFTGDSLELARAAAKVSDARLIAFCGVRFMAETAKILRPERKVLLPDPDAGCPLADTAQPEAVAAMKEKHPDAWVVSYVNTSAAVKALTDVCCTSANAPAVVANVPARKVLFLPDRNLCWHVRQKVADKEMVCWDGGCWVHRLFTAADVAASRRLHRDAEVLVHPECEPEVQQGADFVLSTSGMLRRSKESPARVIIIGTEEGLLHRLRAENPGKEFYCLGSARVCPNMKMTTLEKLARALREEREEIVLPPDVMDKARLSLERMLEYV